jgi:7-carboxy-7-deazaguanine synthase
MSISGVLADIVEYRVRHVCVTGGEPLAQPACLELLTALCDAGYLVSLETSGALDIVAVDRRVGVVLDLKTPASGECARNLWSNLAHLKRDDQIKFVICNRADYDWACEQLRQHELNNRCEVLFSPAWEEQPARELADWILADRLPVRFQVQLHKFLWGNVPGH